ncbi:MBL fold metallo-hydrolase [Curtobacterium luteum]|uniref:MBL fold metallo-hydrolase n=1 Tax=Curtobacterium luteum TaxID=33881 RepID=UPI00382B755F
MNPERWRTPTATRSVTIGDVRVTVVPDGHIQLHPSGWYGEQQPPRPTSEVTPLLDQDGYLVASVGSLVIEVADEVIVVDTGLGPVRVPGRAGTPPVNAMIGGALPIRWREAGLPEPTRVVITHLHEDHTGWWRSDHAHGDHLRALPIVAGSADIASSALAGMSDRWEPADGGEVLAPGVSVVPLTGHTAGHIGVRVESRGEHFLAFGDALHSVLQVPDPSINAVVEHDRTAATATRVALLHDVEERAALVYGNHFADVVFGRVRDRRWIPEH